MWDFFLLWRHHIVYIEIWPKIAKNCVNVQKNPAATLKHQFRPSNFFALTEAHSKHILSERSVGMKNFKKYVEKSVKFHRK